MISNLQIRKLHPKQIQWFTQALWLLTKLNRTQVAFQQIPNKFHNTMLGHKKWGLFGLPKTIVKKFVDVQMPWIME